MGFGNSIYLSPKSESPLKWTPKQLEARKKRLLNIQDQVDEWVSEAKSNE